MSEENNIKIILVGSSGTGKTNIIKAITNSPFSEDTSSTLTSAFVAKNMKIGNKIYNIELWDTAGQEKYRSLTKIFIVSSKIVIFVYDITQKRSFEEIDYWVKTVKESLDGTPIFALFGNKKDLYLEEQVDENEGKNKGEEIGAYFKLTSAKSERENLNEYINELVTMYVNKNLSNNNETYHREESFALQYNNKKNKKKGGCCDNN